MILPQELLSVINGSDSTAFFSYSFFQLVQPWVGPFAQANELLPANFFMYEVKSLWRCLKAAEMGFLKMPQETVMSQAWGMLHEP